MCGALSTCWRDFIRTSDLPKGIPLFSGSCFPYRMDTVSPVVSVHTFPRTPKTCHIVDTQRTFQTKLEPTVVEATVKREQKEGCTIFRGEENPPRP